NFFWNTEVQAGFAWTHDIGTRFSDAYIQGKTLFRDSTPESPWSFATVVGAIRRTANLEYRGYDNPYVIAVVTVGITDAPMLVHANIGYSHDPETSIDATLWGIAAEAPVSARIAVMGEAFGDNGRRRYWRLGTRWSAIRDRLDVDLSYIARPGGGI